MKFTKLLFLAGIIFFCASCDKEQDVTPQNIYGIWAHYYDLEEYYDGMRFDEDGNFEYMERYSYEKDFKIKDKVGKDLSYTLVDKTVSIYNNDNGNKTLVRSFVIQKLTKAYLTEDSGFRWTGY